MDLRPINLICQKCRYLEVNQVLHNLKDQSCGNTRVSPVARPRWCNAKLRAFTNRDGLTMAKRVETCPPCLPVPVHSRQERVVYKGGVLGQTVLTGLCYTKHSVCVFVLVRVCTERSVHLAGVKISVIPKHARQSRDRILIWSWRLLQDWQQWPTPENKEQGCETRGEG